MVGMGGIEACRQIRRHFPHLAVLMLTVRDSEDNKVEALEAGADDYVTKPFQVRELVARVQAAVRRSHTMRRDANAVIEIGDITLDPVRRCKRPAEKSTSRPKNLICCIF
jgi:two-component system KDP operon response regulator KdpE